MDKSCNLRAKADLSKSEKDEMDSFLFKDSCGRYVFSIRKTIKFGYLLEVIKSKMGGYPPILTFLL